MQLDPTDTATGSIFKSIPWVHQQTKMYAQLMKNSGGSMTMSLTLTEDTV
jgi:hypothetical protein